MTETLKHSEVTSPQSNSLFELKFRLDLQPIVYLLEIGNWAFGLNHSQGCELNKEKYIKSSLIQILLKLLL